MNELGDIRPSQLIYTFGIGSLIDLPNMSALIMGLDDWDTQYCREIAEDRLLAAVQRRLGGQVSKLFLPPIQFDDFSQDVAAPAIGVPVTVFPRWLRCPLCHTLATVDSGVFELHQDRYRPDKTRYVHKGCTKGDKPTALSVRFLIACREGHLSDFPWIDYVHKGNVPCKSSRLTLREFGASGDVSDIIVKCLECGEDRRMGDAFDVGRAGGFRCPGHHPHLRRTDHTACQEQAKAILLGASNSWFPIVMSALAMPSEGEKLARIITRYWADLNDIDSLEVAQYATKPVRMPFLVEYSPEQIWKGIQEKREKDAQPAAQEAEDLKTPEWKLLSSADQNNQTEDFRLKTVSAPMGFEDFFEDTVLVERIREVRAILGFTRIESNGDFTDVTTVPDGRLTPLARSAPTWVPASDVRGEGIFVRLKEGILQSWESNEGVAALEREFLKSHGIWRHQRRIQPETADFPGIRYVLLHSLSHALMRQIVLDCGYTAASIRERIYCKPPGALHGPMAGFLIYTSAPDSEGTLGGLVDLGNPMSLGRHVQQALECLRICASDPLCAEHSPSTDGRGIHAASCHACLFAPETSCERGNRYLDRCTLIPTLKGNNTAFFKI